MCSKLRLPYLLKADSPHILNLSPPLDLDPKWFAPHLAYTTAKYGMSLCTLGMAEEFRQQGVGVNSLWPLTAIDAAAVRFALCGEDMHRVSRTPDIMADAAYAILARPARERTARERTGRLTHRPVLHRRGGAARGAAHRLLVLCAARARQPACP